MTDTRSESSSGGEGPFIEEAARLLQYDGIDHHLDPLDDLSRRRLLDRLLADLERAGSTSKRPGRSGRFTPWAVAAAVVVACGAGLAAYLWSRGPVAGAPSDAAAAPSVAGPGAILLIEGTARAGGASARIGGPVLGGDVLETGKGRILVSLPTGIDILASEETRLEVDRFDGASIRVVLHAGELTAVVAPGRRGPPFEVSTRFGAARVTGTIFTVGLEADGARLEVLRGTVEILREGRSAVPVPATTALSFDGDGERSVPPSHPAAAADLTRALDLLGPEAFANVTIESDPPGATVRMGGVVLGATPIGLSVRPGHRELGLTLEGHSPVRELMDLSGGDLIRRTFVLEPATAAKSEEPEDVVRPRREDPAPADRAGSPGAASPISPVDMLRAAQDLRGARDWPGAAAAYEDLVRTYPASPQARTALVSLASIELDHLGRGSMALAHFSRYLDTGGGSLAQEASWGRARALGSMGMIDQERAALREYVERYPQSLDVDRARRRIREIEGP